MFNERVMREDELIRIWQSPPNQERVKFVRSRMILEVQLSFDRFQAAVKHRDRLDTWGALVAIPASALAIFFVPFTLSKIALGFIAIWSVYIIFRLKKAKRNKPVTFTETYLSYLYKTRRFLVDQKQLLGTVLYWAVIPYIIFVSLFLIGFWERPGPMINRVLALCGNIGFGALVYFLNKWAVKHQIVPQLEKVDELIKVMENE